MVDASAADTWVVDAFAGSSAGPSVAAPVMALVQDRIWRQDGSALPLAGDLVSS